MKKKFITYLITILVLILPLALSSCSKPEQQEPTPVFIEKLQSPQNFKSERRTVIWDAVENASGYAVSFEGVEYETDECSFDLSFYDTPGTYTVKVKALGESVAYEASDWVSTDIVLKEILAHGYDESLLEYTLLEDRTGYEVYRGGADLNGVIVIPDYFCDLPVKRISDGAFYISDRSATDGNPFIESEAGCNKYTTGYVLPSHLESIGECAFKQNVRIEEIIIPDSVVEIGMGAFLECSHLKKAVLPKGLKIIPAVCFRNTALSEIVLPETLEEIGVQAFFNEYHKLYLNNFDKTQYKIVHFDSELSSITIPKTVTHIGLRAFSGREKLETINMDIENIEWFDHHVFEKTLWYEKQPDGIVCYKGLLYEYKGEMPQNYEIEVSANIKKIAGAAFSGQENLERIKIPSGVKLIGSAIFSGCASLSEVILPTDLEIIPSETFKNNSSLRSIILPETLSQICNLAFCASGIESIYIPDGVKLEAAAFFQCTDLREVRLPNDLDSIGERWFNDCSSLTKITLPSTIKSIEYSAFRNCRSLREIIIPDNVESIGSSAFCGCSSFINVKLPNSLNLIYKNAFHHCVELTGVYYCGDKNAFDVLISKMDLDSDDKPFGEATVYFYSETAPTAEGNFWHYVDGEPTPWK